MMLSQKNPIHIENPVVFYCNMMRFEKLHTAFFFPLKHSHSMFKCLQVPELSLCCFSSIAWTPTALGFLADTEQMDGML